MNKFNWLVKACVVFLLCATGAVVLPAQTFATLHSFDKTGGAAPYATLVQGTDGNLYGTTFSGGTCPSYPGCGTIFKINPNGNLTTLHSFDKTDGDEPEGGLVQGTSGNFYGTTTFGGTNSYGTIFTITPSGMFTTLYNFCSQSGCTDGGNPFATLVKDSDGNLYGTTYDGGANNGNGTIFKITPSGRLTTLHSFHTGEGANPSGALVQGTDGNLYGTTNYGGANNGGTVFKITPSGRLTILHSFDQTEGTNPAAGLVQDTNGNLYGTTYAGGTGNPCDLGVGCGTVFKITPSGRLTTLHNFTQTEGANSAGGLIQDTNGNLYGTTYAGGNGSSCDLRGGCGAVFVITPSGTLTTLYSFCSQSFCVDGASPQGGLVQGNNGKLYGTTLYGGTNDQGTLFSLSVSTDPTAEK